MSETRNEHTQDEIEEVISWIPDRRSEAKTIREGVRLGTPITKTEVKKEWKEIKESAPGKDSITIKMIRNAHPRVQDVFAEKIVRLSETSPDQWEQIIKEGMVIPLFKKGDRKNLNNYRGVCLLAMASRIIARIMASRLREWSERLGLLGENQHGFRPGRSTADAAQIVIRMNEELQARTPRTEDKPKAILLDIKKAYPRVNKGILWAMLKKYGVQANTITILQGLHEYTTYEVRGKEANSAKWKPLRGLREGDASSPVLFNIYHATSIEIASQKRNAEYGGKAGIQWQWTPGNSLPPQDTKGASGNSATEEFWVPDVLFADDTTLIGKDSELSNGKETVVHTLGRFEELCHPDKEEHMELGTPNDIRMLGSYCDRRTDTKKRAERMQKAAFIVKRRLKRSKLSRKTQAKVVEVIVEATGLFDCSIRPWTMTEIKKLQQIVDRMYRFIWSSKKEPPLQEMANKHVNMFAVRKKLGVTSMQMKVEERSLRRIGHVLRMENTRLTKRVTMGWPGENIKDWHHKQKQTTIGYWRKILKDGGKDPDLIETLASDRAKYRSFVNKRTRHIEKWEENRAENIMTTRAQRETASNVCQECGKPCRSLSGLKSHARVHRKDNINSFICAKCTKNFKTKSALVNHGKICEGGEANTCVHCGYVSHANMARHRRTCRRRPLTPTTSVEPRTTRVYRRKDCPLCGSSITHQNLARHMESCKGTPRSQAGPKQG